MSRTLVVWCPDWPVTAVGIGAATPGAAVDGDRVAACTAAARSAGVRRGQRIRDAQRRCPDMVVRDRDLDAEGRLFEVVAAAVGGLTPRVEVVRPGVCAFPAGGAARFHGGEEALRVLVQDTVVEAGHDCGVGIADGLFAAELAARADDGGVIVPPGGDAEFLAPYPPAVLDLPDLADLLRRLGIWTLGQFAALPAGDVAGRFGAEGARAHRLASGGPGRPLAPSPPEHDRSVRAEFDPPAAQADEVIFAAKRLADRLHAGLRADGVTCVRLAVEVGFADGRVRERLWRHEGALSALAVAERVRWQLSAPDPAPAADAIWGGVTYLRLVPDQPIPDEGSQQALWGQVTVTDRVQRAADRIQAMLGHEAITRPVLVGGRGPGEQVVRVPVGDLPPSRRGDGPWPGRVPAPAPAAVPPEPPHAAVTDVDDVTVRVDARCAVSAPPAHVAVAGGPPRRVTAWTGPWPVGERWWDPGQARRLARFQVVTDDGRAYLLMLEGGLWRVEAVYD
ncbi:MAG TPA: DNA polymerase Y family protein [Streptosporangiaceae bacterium]|nr:DNA polymerase Y family protein [Streptosporangiaceae bacterium]